MARGKRGRVTLRDVAERAGVSVTTASFVLSGRHEMRISAATEERVLQAARMLDYRRRLVHRAALPSGAPAIGLISDVVATESFGGEMMRGCIAAATERGHVVLIADSEGVDELEESAVRALLAPGRRQVRLRDHGHDRRTSVAGRPARPAAGADEQRRPDARARRRSSRTTTGPGG